MLGLASLALVATLALVAAASAHSTFLETEPLHFDEPVEPVLGSITVYDGEGERVDAGEITRGAPESVAASAPAARELGAPAATAEGDDGNGIAIAALVVGIAGLAAGLKALFMRRGRAGRSRVRG
jgi:hypothetical protein